LTVGVGAEWAVTSNWLVKVEYDYVDFGTTNYNVTNVALPGGAVTVLNRNATTTLNIGKVGAAYKF
jgi:opacity protein-like surface antigen